MFGKTNTREMDLEKKDVYSERLRVSKKRH
jgi:hypothetical protein